MRHIFFGVLIRSVLLGSMGCLLAPLSALADSGVKGIQVTPFAGYRFGGSFKNKDTDENFDVDDNQSFGLIVNFPHDEVTEWEIYYSHQATNVDLEGFQVTPARVDLDIEYLQIGGTYLVDETESTKPYLVATAGIAKISPDAAGTESDTFFSFGIGGGYKYFPTTNFGLRLDGRLLGTFISSDSKIFCKSDQQGGGCAINLSGESLFQFEVQAGFIFRF